MGCAKSQVAKVTPVFLSAGIDLPSSKDKHRQHGQETEMRRSPFHEQHIIDARLGKGAFAQVFTTRRKSDNKEFATKILDLRAAKKNNDDENQKRGVDSRARLMADHEVHVLKKIGKQDYCISLIESFREGYFTYIVMEKCNQTLLQAMEQTPNLNERFYAGIFRDMLQALDSIHSLRVVHLDVKPDNFLYTGGQNGVVKLCDFGLAKTIKAGTQGLKHVVGTAPFMAPEMLKGEYYNEMVDMWSFGVIMYVLMFGEFPYQPEDRSPQGMREAIKTGAREMSFKPRASLQASGVESDVVSRAAIDFMASALCRDPALRISAHQALRHPWLKQRVADDVGMPSLRPMLHSAKKFGAFFPVPKKEDQKDLKQDDMEMQMALMQAKADNLGFLFSIEAACPQANGTQSLHSTMASAQLRKCGKDGKVSPVDSYELDGRRESRSSRSTKTGSSRGFCNSVGSSSPDRSSTPRSGW